MSSFQNYFHFDFKKNPSASLSIWADFWYHVVSLLVLIYTLSYFTHDTLGIWDYAFNVHDFHLHIFPLVILIVLGFVFWRPVGDREDIHGYNHRLYASLLTLILAGYCGGVSVLNNFWHYDLGVSITTHVDTWLPFWQGDFDLFFQTDALSLMFLLLTNFLLMVCLLLLVPSLAVDPKAYLGIAVLALLWWQLIVTFLAQDLLLFFVAFESLMIPLLFLIGIWGSPNRLQANNYLYFYTAVGAVGMLLAILYLWSICGTTNLFLVRLLTPALTWTEKTWLWLGFFLAFAVKTPLVPFHIWLPKAHVEAPTTGSVLLAGLLLKIGLYGLLRICLGLFPDVSMWAAPLVSTLAVVGLIYASLITLRQIDMKRIIAYSSVAHMSLSLASVMTGSALGVAAGVYLSLSHGIVSSALFILVGALYARFHNRLVTYYGGLITWMPYFGVCFGFFSLANMAFPLTSGFMGEFWCLTAILAQNNLLGILASSSMLFSTVYSMLLFNRVFFGSLKLECRFTTTAATHSLDLTKWEAGILAPFILLTVYFGIFPSPLMINYVF
jgi:NADH-quinone oxidoreductase subunit M